MKYRLKKENPLNDVSVYNPAYITVYILCVHKTKDQNPTDIKLETIKK